MITNMNDEALIVQADGLTRSYGDGHQFCALDGVTFTIPQGQFLAILGPSGSGKSTLLNLVGTLDQPTSGSITVDGVDILTLQGDHLANFRREKIGFVFQMFYLVPTLTTVENVMMPLIQYRRGLDFNLEERTNQLLITMGLEGKGDLLPGQLSGGEQQRVAIARALINHPKLLLADEPTGNLDRKTGQEVIQLIHQLNREEGITVLVVTHDTAIASGADRVISLQHGRILDDLRRLAD